MAGQNGGAPAGQRSPSISLGVPYAAALGLVVLILLAERKARRRELALIGELAEKAELLERADARIVEGQERAMNAWAENERLEYERQELARGLAERVSLPTDALAIVTPAGQLCPDGMDHPAGSQSQRGWGGSPSAPACETCKAFVSHFGRRDADRSKDPGL
jgi:hypothetical protein